MGRTVVGLDIGHTAVRAVAVSAGSSPTVTAIGTAPLPPGAVHEGEVMDPTSVSVAIRQAWASSGKGKSRLGKDVVLGVSGRHVIVRQMELPWMEEAAFRKALPYRVAGMLPVPVEDVILQPLVLRESASRDANGGRMVDILLVAAMRQPVLRAVEAVEKAGLRPIRVELSGLALLRASGPSDLPAGVAEARVDIGAEVTTVVVQVDGVPRFVRMLAGEGGSQISQALVDRLQVDPDLAEALKRHVGLSSAPAGADQAHPQHVQAAQLVIERGSDSLLTAVQSSLDYFLSSTDEVAGLGRVVLSGGGAALPGLDQRFAESLGIPVVVADPFAVLSTGKADVPSDPSLVVAAGLSLAEVA